MLWSLPVWPLSMHYFILLLCFTASAFIRSAQDRISPLGASQTQYSAYQNRDNQVSVNSLANKHRHGLHNKTNAELTQNCNLEDPSMLYTHIYIPYTHIYKLYAHIYIPYTHIYIKRIHIYTYRIHIYIPHTYIHTAYIYIYIPYAHIYIPYIHVLYLSKFSKASIFSYRCNLSSITLISSLSLRDVTYLPFSFFSVASSSYPPPPTPHPPLRWFHAASGMIIISLDTSVNHYSKCANYFEVWRSRP